MKRVWGDAKYETILRAPGILLQLSDQYGQRASIDSYIVYTYADSICCDSYLGSLFSVIRPDFEDFPKSDDWALRTHLATKIGN